MEWYWFVLYADTFLWVKRGVGCVYNTLNYSIFRFKNVGKLESITQGLLNMDNLYRIELSTDDLDDLEVRQFVCWVRATDSGKLVMNTDENIRPVSMKPELKIQDDIRYFQWAHAKNIDGHISHHLYKLIFYLNGSENGHSAYNKQVVFPLSTHRCIELEKVISYIESGKRSEFLSEILFVGNIWRYQNCLQLFAYLEKIGRKVIFYGIDKDVLPYIEEIRGWVNEMKEFKIWITDFDVSKELFVRLKNCKQVVFCFTIRSIEEYVRVENIVSETDLQNVEILPIYEGDNLCFFKEHLSLQKEDINEIKLSKREIFIRQTLNIHDFGKLYIMPDGSIFGNPNDEKIGTIDEPLYDIVYREMTEGKSWFRIRDQKPCCDCVYQWLCPSPSNYELVIGHPNLCHIKNT